MSMCLLIRSGLIFLAVLAAAQPQTIGLAGAPKRVALPVTATTAPGQTAEAASFHWWAAPGAVPLDSTSAGFVHVMARKPVLTGQYVVEVAAPPATGQATAQIRLVSKMDEYTALLRAVPGAQTHTTTLRGSGQIVFDIPTIMGDALFEIAVEVEVSAVRLKLPGGKVLTSSEPSTAGHQWDSYVENDAGGNRPMSAALLIMSNALLPIQGTHHIVMLKAPAGRYVVEADAGASPVRVFASFIPFDQLMKAVEQRKELANEPAPGQIKIVDPQTLPYDCFAGDAVPLVVKMVGIPQNVAPRFEVRIQTQVLLEITENGGRRYRDPGPPDQVPVDLILDTDGAWHGSVTLSKPGLTQVSLRASVAALETEVLLTNSHIDVHPIVARMLALAAIPVDENGDGRFERLDVSADLDVASPGNYFLTATIAGGEGRTVNLAGKAVALRRGRQTLTASLPAKMIWTGMGDGPFLIRSVVVLRSELGNSIAVPHSQPDLRTAAWKRDQWNPGQVVGADTVAVRGIRPNTSGKFRFVEVRWEVTTPGGECYWDGELSGPTIATAKISDAPAHVSYRAMRPSGRSSISFIFDGALVSAPATGRWSFNAIIQCGADEMRRSALRMEFPPGLSLDAAHFETVPTSFAVRVKNPEIVIAGESVLAGVSAIGVDQMRFALDSVPAGLELTLIPVEPSPSAIKASFATIGVRALPGARPGRYIAAISGQSGSEIARTELLIDVIAP